MKKKTTLKWLILDQSERERERGNEALLFDLFLI